MLSHGFRFLTLKIAGFRGVRDFRMFDLDGSVVLLHGPNGTGKTSFFDALQWLFLGSVERLDSGGALMGFDGKRKKTDHIVNAYCENKRQASVAADVSLNGKRVTLIRTGDRKRSTFEIVGAMPSRLYGREAKQWLARSLLLHDTEALDGVFILSELLEQDAMRAVLQSSAQDRYDQISTLLGLHHLQGFECDVRESLKKATVHSKKARAALETAEASYDAVVMSVERMEMEVAGLKPIDTYAEELFRLAEGSPAYIDVELPAVPDASDAIMCAQKCWRLSNRLNRLLSVLNTSDEAGYGLSVFGIPDGNLGEEQINDRDGQLNYEHLDEASRLFKEHVATVEELEVRLENIQQALIKAENDSQRIARLAAAAIPLLGVCCPVCEQSIDPQQVEKRLNEISTDTAELIQHREAVYAEAARLEFAKKKMHESKSRLDALQQASEAMQAFQRRQADIESQLSDILRDTPKQIRIDDREISG